LAERSAPGLPSKRNLPKISDVNQPALDAFREKLLLKGYSRNTQRTYYYEFAQLPYLLKDLDAKGMNLKITDIDSGNMQVLIARTKGKKDRYVNLPESIIISLPIYLKTGRM
jgi:hypothetical protein